MLIYLAKQDFPLWQDCQQFEVSVNCFGEGRLIGQFWANVSGLKIRLSESPGYKNDGFYITPDNNLWPKKVSSDKSILPIIDFEALRIETLKMDNVDFSEGHFRFVNHSAKLATRGMLTIEGLIKQKNTFRWDNRSVKEMQDRYYEIY